jgi:hypothetical protein
MDKTGITSVQKLSKIVASKGVCQVGKVTSGELGVTVTAICAMSAADVFLSPMFILPRKRMVDSLMRETRPQAVGYADPSGWTDSDLFLKWLEHFVSFTNCSNDAPHIIILDGHHSHKTLSAINYAQDHGIHLITLPPQCNHKMQPLDRTYFKSLKSVYNSQADSWMVANPGKRITLPDMPGLSAKAFLRSETPEKAIDDFKTCGLWPYDANVFTDDDFIRADLTDETPTEDINNSNNAGNATQDTHVDQLEASGSAEESGQGNNSRDEAAQVQGSDNSRDEPTQVQGSNNCRDEAAQGSNNSRGEVAQVQGSNNSRGEAAQVQGSNNSRDEVAQVQGSNNNRGEAAQVQGSNNSRGEAAQVHGSSKNSRITGAMTMMD